MGLASYDITINIGREALHLRASLRAGTRLVRRYGDFGTILRAVANGELGVIARVIEETSVYKTDVPAMLDAIAAGPLRHGLEAVIPAAHRVVLQLAGADDEASERTEDAGPPVTLDEYYAELFRIGTGWLGWPPETVWNATAAEIIDAHKGRVDMLRAVFGGAADDVPGEQQPDFRRDADAAAKLRALAGPV